MLMFFWVKTTENDRAGYIFIYLKIFFLKLHHYLFKTLPFVGRHPFHPLKLHYRSESTHTDYNLTTPPTVATDTQTLTVLSVP